MAKSAQPQCVSCKDSEDHITKAVTSYSPGYGSLRPKKSAGIISSAFHEVFTNKPSTVKTSMSAPRQRKQMIAIALSKARAAGARIPKK